MKKFSKSGQTKFVILIKLLEKLRKTLENLLIKLIFSKKVIKKST